MSYIVPSGLSPSPVQLVANGQSRPLIPINQQLTQGRSLGQPIRPIQVVQPTQMTVVRPATVTQEVVPTSELVQSQPILRPVIKTMVTKVGSRYSKVINIFGDIGYLDSSIKLEDILVQDKLYSFFKEILLETDTQIGSELQSAVQFYNDRFGVDLSKFKPVDGYWISGEHRFYPYQKMGNYHAFEIDGPCCAPISKTCIEGGFVLSVGSPGLVGRGTYGKETGENISPGSIIFFGYYVLIDEDSNGSIYHFRSNTPSKTSVEVPLTWNLDVYDYRTTMWGKSIGSSIVEKKGVNAQRIGTSVVNTQGFVPTVTTINSPVGTRQIDTLTTIRNNEPMPLIVNNVPVAASSRTEVLTSPVNVPTYAPIIRQELMEYQDDITSNVVLISRNTITF